MVRRKARIKLKARKMNGQSSLDNQLKYKKHKSYYSFTLFCHEQSSKSEREASALYH